TEFARLQPVLRAQGSRRPREMFSPSRCRAPTFLSLASRSDSPACGRAPRRSRRVIAVKVLFWLSFIALVWTHVAYPAVAALVARIAPRRVRKEEIEPTVAIIVAAYNEEPVIGRRIENLLELDYPREELQIVVTSDASSDRTEEIAAGYPGVKVIRNER